MTDYTNLIDKVNIPELVEALRCLALSKKCDSCNYGYRLSTDSECNDACDIEQIVEDAAAVIEALQAEVNEAKKSADAYRAMYFTKHGDITIEKVRELDEIDCHFHSALIRLMYKRIEELEAQLPKRGEWVKGPDGLYHCSVCGVTAPYLDAFDGVIQYWDNLFYCNNCGAKMEV